MFRQIRSLVKNAKRVLFAFYFLYFLFFCLLIKALFKKRFAYNLFTIKTDHIGDAIIWERLLVRSDFVVGRDNKLFESYGLNIKKFYLNPLYMIRVFRELYVNSKYVFVPCSSKTPDMFVLAVMADSERKVTIRDDNGNMMFARWLETRIFSDVLPNACNEYSNVDILFDNYLRDFQVSEIPFQSLGGKRVVLMPFASQMQKEISIDQFAALLERLDESKVKIIEVVGLVSDEKKGQYEKLIEKYERAKSLINKVKITEYKNYYAGSNDLVYIGMDTSLFHLFYKFNLADKYYVILGLGYGLRFLPSVDKVVPIYNNCKFSGCNWNCVLDESVCIKGIDFK